MPPASAQCMRARARARGPVKDESERRASPFLPLLALSLGARLLRSPRHGRELGALVGAVAERLLTRDRTGSRGPGPRVGEGSISAERAQCGSSRANDQDL